MGKGNGDIIKVEHGSSCAVTILLSHSIAKNEQYLAKFANILHKMASYPELDYILNFAATKARSGQLTFELKDTVFFELDSGNCKAIQGTMFNHVMNAFRNEKKYLISIKKIKASVIIHELAHMIENELYSFKSKQFHDCFIKDMRASLISNLSLQTIINSKLVNDLKLYPASEHHAEVFARFFELICLCNEISGHEENTGYDLLTLCNSFPNLMHYINNILKPKVLDRTYTDITEYSANRNKNAKRSASWSNDKVHSIHADTKKPQWRRTVKSIKDT